MIDHFIYRAVVTCDMCKTKKATGVVKDANTSPRIAVKSWLIVRRQTLAPGFHEAIHVCPDCLRKTIREGKRTIDV